MGGCASLARSRLPLILSYKSEKSLCASLALARLPLILSYSSEKFLCGADAGVPNWALAQFPRTKYLPPTNVDNYWDWELPPPQQVRV